MTTRLSQRVSTSLPLHPCTTRGFTAQGPGTTFTITKQKLLFRHFWFQVLSSSFLHVPSCAPIAKAFSSCVFLNTKACSFDRSLSSWTLASARWLREKVALSTWRPRDIIQYFLVVVGCCLWCRDVAFRPRPLTPPPLEFFFSLSFFKWCLHHGEKMSTRTHTDTRHVIFCCAIGTFLSLRLP